MPKKLSNAARKPKLRPSLYLGAFKSIENCDQIFACVAIMAERVDRAPWEVDFFQRLFELDEDRRYCFQTICPKLNWGQLRELRLMALALCHTLAVEQNNGRQVL